MSAREPWFVRVALRAVPRSWRDMVRDDLADQFGNGPLATGRRAAHALTIAVPLHWTFTRAAFMATIREAFRSLRQAQGFAIGAIATFALGIGVNLAVFSAVDRMLFRPLPYADPDRLVVMAQFDPGSAEFYSTLPSADVVGARTLPAVVGVATAEWNTDGYRLTENPDGARYLTFVRVSYTTLGTLGVRPALGHDFVEADARTGRHAVLISDEAWRHDFGSRADVLGQRIWSATVGTTAEVIGVLPADFMPPQVVSPTLTWSGIAVDDDTMDVARPKDRSGAPVLRLASSVSIDAAQAQITAMDRQVGASLGAALAAPPGAIRLMKLKQAQFGAYATYLTLVFAAATLVLLVACANLASLLLVRARSREHRFALQRALGASTARVVGAAVAEAVILAFAGSVVAIIALRLADHAIAAWLPPLFSKYAAPVLERRALVFTTVVATASAVIAGAWPGWRASRVDVSAVIQRGHNRVQTRRLAGSGAILCVEIGLCFVLVACATLAGRNLVRLLTTDLGFEPTRLVQLTALLPPSADVAALRARYGDMLRVLRAMPGVEAATGADSLSITGSRGNAAMGDPDQRGGRFGITDQFVETVGLRLLAGRTISSADVASLAPVGLLSESGVRLVWPDATSQQAVGRTLHMSDDVPREVVGVVADVRGAYDEPSWPSLYVPSGPKNFRIMNFALRLAPGVTLRVADVARRLTAQGFEPTRVGVSPVSDRLASGVVDPAFRAELLSGFGFVALALAMVGLYAVQSFNVVQRTTEFGVRLSLGATSADLWRMLTRQMLGPVLAGIAAGFLGSLWASQFMQALLSGIDTRDPWTYVGVAAALGAAAVAATILPARRAARTDPAIALRAQ